MFPAAEHCRNTADHPTISPRHIFPTEQLYDLTCVLLFIYFFFSPFEHQIVTAITWWAKESCRTATTTANRCSNTCTTPTRCTTWRCTITTPCRTITTRTAVYRCRPPSRKYGRWPTPPRQRLRRPATSGRTSSAPVWRRPVSPCPTTRRCLRPGRRTLGKRDVNYIFMPTTTAATLWYTVESW